MSTGLISRLRDALDCMPEFAKTRHKLIAEADAYLANGGWVRVEDALPVVPEGAEYVYVWLWREASCTTPWHDQFHPDYPIGADFWRYAEPEPNAPEQTK